MRIQRCTVDTRLFPLRGLVCFVLVTACTLAGVSRPAAADEPAASELKPIEPEAVELGRPVDFSRDIAPILKKNCTACHSQSVGESGLSAESAETLLKGGDRGAAVIPEKPKESPLFRFVSRAEEPVMPPPDNDVQAEPLTPRELGLLRQWILEGARAGSTSPSAGMRWQSLTPQLNSIYSVAFSPWGRFAACARANQISIYDVVIGEQADRLIDPNLSSVVVDGNPMYASGAAHRDFVHALAFHPDGRLLASGGYRTVKLWQRPQNVRKTEFNAPEAITAAAASPDGTAFALAVADHTIVVVNKSDGALLATLSGHTAVVTGLAYLPDGTQLVSASHDKTIRRWNAADGSPVGQIETPAAVNGLALNQAGTQIVTAAADNTVRIWPVPPVQGETPVAAVAELSGHEKPVLAVACMPSDDTRLVSGGEDGTVRVWNVNEKKQLAGMDHGSPVTALAVRPDGAVVASAGTNGEVRLWQSGDGKSLAQVKTNTEAQRTVIRQTDDQTVAKQQAGLAAAAVTDAEKNVKDREETLKNANEAKTAADKAIEEAAQKEKSAVEAQAKAKSELEKDKENKDLQKKSADADKAAADAKAALTKAEENQVSAQRAITVAQQALETMNMRLAEAKSQQAAAEAAGQQADAQLADAQKAAEETRTSIRSVAFSADGKRLATAGEDGAVCLWDASAGAALDTFTGHQAAVTAVLFTSDGTLASASIDKSIVCWDTNPPWQLVGQLGPASETPLDIGSSPFVGRVLALDFSPDGKLLATGGGEPSRSGEIILWNVAERSMLRKFEEPHSDTVQAAEFSRDGKYLLTGAADKFVKIFATETGAHVRSFEGHTHHVLDVSWKADGATISSAGADHAIKVWNVETGEQRRTISHYGKQVTAIQFIGTGDDVISAGGDKMVRLHRTSNGQKLRDFSGGTDFMYTAAATRDGAVVVAGGEDGVLRLWNGNDGKSLMTFAAPAAAANDDTQASLEGENAK